MSHDFQTVKICNISKILCIQILLHIQTTPVQQKIPGTVDHQFPKFHFLILYIQIFQESSSYIQVHFVKGIREPVLYAFNCRLMQNFCKSALRFFQVELFLQIICNKVFSFHGKIP